SFKNGRAAEGKNPARALCKNVRF
ncbi:MAG: hypothetical protein QOF74_8126, partial [Caballeronia mineralivorans]|nr:hypothetical protein [Caballeronia mineralivorans]